MRFVCLLLSLVFVPPLAFAQAKSASPILVTDDAQKAPAPAANDKTQAAAPAPETLTPAEKILNNYPDWAVSKAGAETTGQGTSITPAPASPPPPSAPASPENPPAPAAPKSPASPPSPVDKLWPKDTVPIFMRSCTGFHVELINACSCVITHMMLVMPHDEFMALSVTNSVNSDPRVITIRQKCLGTPGNRSDAPPNSAQ